MASYKLLGQDMLFQLMNEEVREDFSVWDNINKKYLRQIEGVNDLNDLKFMKADLFKQRYPNLRKNTQYIRHILVYEHNALNDYDFGFKKTANDAINTFIGNMKVANKNPLNFRLVLRVTGKELSTEYKVIGMDEVGSAKGILQAQALTQANQQYNVTPSTIGVQAPQEPFKPLSVSSGASLPFSLEVPKKALFELSSIEQQMVAEFKNYQEKCSEDRYVEVWEWNEPKRFNTRTPDARIREIYKQTYKK